MRNGGWDIEKISQESKATHLARNRSSPSSPAPGPGLPTLLAVTLVPVSISMTPTGSRIMTSVLTMVEAEALKSYVTCPKLCP